MDQPAPTSDRAQRSHRGDCEAEYHLRLCARRAPSGHLEYHWRLEVCDLIDTDGESHEGVFGPFQLPHESGQEVAASVRHWLKLTAQRIRERQSMPADDDHGEQLTLRDVLVD
jgi:hypothetical protein